MIKKLVGILLSIVALNATAQTNTVSFAWEPSCNTNIKSFVLYYGTNVLSVPKTNVYVAHIDDCGTDTPAQTNIYKGDYNRTQTILGYTNTTITVSNIVKGLKYFFALSCKTESNLESDLSNEVEYTIPLYSSNTIPSKVSGLRIIEVK